MCSNCDAEIQEEQFVAVAENQKERRVIDAAEEEQLVVVVVVAVVEAEERLIVFAVEEEDRPVIACGRAGKMARRSKPRRRCVSGRWASSSSRFLFALSIL